MPPKGNETEGVLDPHTDHDRAEYVRTKGFSTIVDEGLYWVRRSESVNRRRQMCRNENRIRTKQEKATSKNGKHG